MNFLQLSRPSFSLRLNYFKVVLLRPLDSLLQADFSFRMMNLPTFVNNTLLFLDCPENSFSSCFSFEKIIDD